MILKLHVFCSHPDCETSVLAEVGLDYEIGYDEDDTREYYLDVTMPEGWTYTGRKANPWSHAYCPEHEGGWR